MMNNQDRRSVPGLLFLGLLTETTVEQAAGNDAEPAEEEQFEPRGWALKWDSVALSQILGGRIGVGPSFTDEPAEGT